MSVRFLHTADLHLGKTYRGSPGEAERYRDFFLVLEEIVAAAIAETVDFVLIAGDLFHTGQILPRTFADTIEALRPLREADIPCIAVEGNHDWIHRRERLSWMEALSQMGYLHLLRPEREEDGGYRFAPFDAQSGTGGHLALKGVNLYGVGYLGAQAGAHVERICQAVTTERNLLLFHVGIWSYTPVEIGKMQPEEAAPLATRFDYVALGHGHKPYIIETADGRPYAFNPGAPECVNLGEEGYAKGFYRVTWEKDGSLQWQTQPTRPRPVHSFTLSLDGAAESAGALELFRRQLAEKLSRDVERAPLLDLKLTGKVGFHPFELDREQLLAVLAEFCAPLHVEWRNHLSLVTAGQEEATAGKGLAAIEKEVIAELIGASSLYRAGEEKLVRLALALRDQLCRGEADGADLLDLLDGLEL